MLRVESKAAIMELAARGSHDPKVVNSILIGRIFHYEVQQTNSNDNTKLLAISVPL